mmetsp:Transcript_69901/g.221451  ORF Transcript_69901/g.221451 Transcript_69901/m.221451 type:complete len:256 (+) Transcript_69901:755-1522(+)
MPIAAGKIEGRGALEAGAGAGMPTLAVCAVLPGGAREGATPASCAWRAVSLSDACCSSTPWGKEEMRASVSLLRGWEGALRLQAFPRKTWANLCSHELVGEQQGQELTTRLSFSSRTVHSLFSSPWVLRCITHSAHRLDWIAMSPTSSFTRSFCGGHGTCVSWGGTARATVWVPSEESQLAPSIRRCQEAAGALIRPRTSKHSGSNGSADSRIVRRNSTFWCVSETLSSMTGVGGCALSGAWTCCAAPPSRRGGT